MPEKEEPSPENPPPAISPGEDGGLTAAAISEDDSQAPQDPEQESATLLPFPVVAIAGPAGALEAYIELLRSVAPDTGMAFVIAPHLSAEQEAI